MAQAAAPGATPVPGLRWALPFACVLLSIALFPVLAPRLWHRRMGLICAAWIAVLLIPQAAVHGIDSAASEAWHAIVVEYLPFMTLLLALFTAGGGILVQGGPGGTPAGNTVLLAAGTVLAGVMGTTGISMVLIHPFLRANAHRSRKVHLVVFFILLVANAGGATSPLGDPPLLIGFLHGVPFKWPVLHLSLPLLVLAVPLLVIFLVLDLHLAADDPMPEPRKKLRIRGWNNVGLIVVVVAAVFLQGIWRPAQVVLLGQPIGIERLVGIGVFLAVTAISIATTPLAIREGNMFTWEPMKEVGKLFIAIFITIGPVLSMLAAGMDGPLAPVLHLASNAAGEPSAAANFWLTGSLSAVLDNAPTYLVFFELAGGDAARLTGELNHVLAAISCGAVFFGGATYIGNAPNLMVRSIASHRGVRMPGFFGYSALALPLLLPLFVLLTLLFFSGAAP